MAQVGGATKKLRNLRAPRIPSSKMPESAAWMHAVAAGVFGSLRVPSQTPSQLRVASWYTRCSFFILPAVSRRS